MEETGDKRRKIRKKMIRGSEKISELGRSQELVRRSTGSKKVSVFMACPRRICLGRVG